MAEDLGLTSSTAKTKATPQVSCRDTEKALLSEALMLFSSKSTILVRYQGPVSEGQTIHWLSWKLSLQSTALWYLGCDSCAVCTQRGGKIGRERIFSGQPAQWVAFTRKRKKEDHQEGKYLQQKYFIDGFRFKYKTSERLFSLYSKWYQDWVQAYTASMKIGQSRKILVKNWQLFTNLNLSARMLNSTPWEVNLELPWTQRQHHR